jgi:hypothetical protein
MIVDFFIVAQPDSFNTAFIDAMAKEAGLVQRINFSGGHRKLLLPGSAFDDCL